MKLGLSVGQILKGGALAVLIIAFTLPATSQTGTGSTGTGTGTSTGTGTGTGTSTGFATGGSFAAQTGTVFCTVSTSLLTTGTGTGTGTGVTAGITNGNLQCATIGGTPIGQNLSFISEGVVPNNFVLAPTPPPLASDVLTGLLSGTSELRQRVLFSAGTDTMTVENFAVPVGTTFPFPAVAIAAPGTVISRINIQVQSAIVTDGSSPAMLFSGTVISNPVGASTFGDLTGRAAAVSVAFTTPISIPGISSTTTGTGTSTGTTTATTIPGVTGTPFSFFGSNAAAAAQQSSMLQVMVAGSFVTVAPNAVTSAVFTPFTGTTGTGTGTGTGTATGTGAGSAFAPTIIVAPIPQPVMQMSVTLDASGSTSPNGGTLTYRWTSLQGVATITNADTATPTIQFLGGPGQYAFGVVVTNPEGFSSAMTVPIFFTGP